MRLEDKEYIRLALSLAAKAKGMTSPNPCVGAVVVKDGRIVGKGYHKYAGGPHAEVYALRQAGRKAKGATLYVSLEPCSHYGRTPPCVDAIVSAGIKRVVAAMKDPNPVNNGKGFAILRRNGIRVETGVLESEARKFNEEFVKFITKKIPFVTVKVAQTLDGKIATRTGDSKWISAEGAREFVHKLRSQADAIMVGANTVLIDDPLLTVRLKGRKIRQPLRVVLSGKSGIPPSARIVHNKGGRTMIIRPKGKTGRVDIKRLLKELAGRGVTHVLIEGGGEVIASALKAKVVDKVYFFIAPKIIGGREAKTSVEGEGIGRIARAIGLKDMTSRNIGGDILIEGYVRY